MEPIKRKHLSKSVDLISSPSLLILPSPPPPPDYHLRSESTPLPINNNKKKQKRQKINHPITVSASASIISPHPISLPTPSISPMSPTITKYKLSLSTAKKMRAFCTSIATDPKFNVKHWLLLTDREYFLNKHNKSKLRKVVRIGDSRNILLNGVREDCYCESIANLRNPPVGTLDVLDVKYKTANNANSFLTSVTIGNQSQAVTTATRKVDTIKVDTGASFTILSVDNLIEPLKLHRQGIKLAKDYNRNTIESNGYDVGLRVDTTFHQVNIAINPEKQSSLLGNDILSRMDWNHKASENILHISDSATGIINSNNNKKGTVGSNGRSCTINDMELANYYNTIPKI